MSTVAPARTITPPVPAEVCRDFFKSSKIEWLETNGTGAFAMGTVAGVNTRRYHAALLVSLKPPVERRVLVARMEDQVTIDGVNYELGACQYPGAVAPQGFQYLDEFRADPCATWTFGLNGAKLEKQIYLIEGKQAGIVRYRADRPMTLRVRPFLAGRDYHALRHVDWGVPTDPKADFYSDGTWTDDGHWYNNIEYLEELDRGMEFREDLYTPGFLTIELRAGEWSPICISMEGPCYAEPNGKHDYFVVKRADGKPTIMAGYPWFTDWGRDTMISLPGLLITPGRLEEARSIIEGFLAFRKDGIIPNRFPDAGEQPEYNTADGTLWIFQAVRAWLAAGGDFSFVRDVMYPAGEDIIAWHRRGTWYSIGVDPEDHLLVAGTPGTQLTWMDAKVGDWVCTPRHGKPVEINALWHGALCLMAEWAGKLGDEAASVEYLKEAGLVRDSFRARFWNEDRSCLFDVINERGSNRQIRPNQIFAVSLGNGLLEPERQRAVVRMVEKELLTPVGLKTLESSDPEYRPRYQGSAWERDGSYHQGTVWPWLLGPFIDAYMIAFGKNDQTVTYCKGLVDAMQDAARSAGCITSIAEIYDADEPRYPRGCPAQAWSVAEVQRVKATYGLD